MSALPTPAKPWYGEPLPVPSYLNGLPVISAVRVPTGRGEVSHVWMVIVYDETGRRGPRGGLITCEVHFQGGWKSHDDERWTDYRNALNDMLTRASVSRSLAVDEPDA